MTQTVWGMASHPKMQSQLWSDTLISHLLIIYSNSWSHICVNPNLELTPLWIYSHPSMSHNLWLIKSTYIWIQVYIKEFFINSIRKHFVPFWIDSTVDIENDPYTTDCSDQTNATNPHAYTQFTITNGELSSQNCIEKPPGNLI